MIPLDKVVEVFVLAHHDVDTGISLDALNAGRIGAAFVDGLVQSLPLACHFDASLIHSPACAHALFAPTKSGGQHRQDLHRPAVHGAMLNENAALLHHFFRLPKTQRVGHLPTHASEYDFQWVMQPLQDFVQGVDQTVAEIKHGPDGLMRGWDNIERATVNGRDHQALEHDVRQHARRLGIPKRLGGVSTASAPAWAALTHSCTTAARRHFKCIFFASSVAL